MAYIEPPEFVGKAINVSAESTDLLLDLLARTIPLAQMLRAYGLADPAPAGTGQDFGAQWHGDDCNLASPDAPVWSGDCEDGGTWVLAWVRLDDAGE